MPAFTGLHSVIAQSFDYTQGMLDRIIQKQGLDIDTSTHLDTPVKPEDDFEKCFYITNRMDEFSRREWTKVTSRRTIVGHDENLGIVMNQ